MFLVAVRFHLYFLPCWCVHTKTGFSPIKGILLLNTRLTRLYCIYVNSLNFQRPQILRSTHFAKDYWIIQKIEQHTSVHWFDLDIIRIQKACYAHMSIPNIMEEFFFETHSFFLTSVYKGTLWSLSLSLTHILTNSLTFIHIMRHIRVRELYIFYIFMNIFSAHYCLSIETYRCKFIELLLHICNFQ